MSPFILIYLAKARTILFAAAEITAAMHIIVTAAQAARKTTRLYRRHQRMKTARAARKP